ncbi:hypothetical protein G4177_09965 [Corallococcus sp. ZKHCc1 1396]|uniref:Stc1 domain-containing protein n=1 Tax=Corallococcus soli TaxID=2710757 RepID=A0ABR9PKQ5_9BACT|nr:MULTISPECIES: hypothetical protein [Corallococcus]MBE4748489.1 hypothetical protein [Corallococcus soli]MCY1034723.1 hypothetical protein [Corallococcus sp. BB11-1]
MLYKVTPMMVPVAPEKEKAREPGQPRKRRKSSVYDADGHEVLISLMCLKCKTLRPLAQFGLRKMADGAIRNQPWCRGCRSGAGTKKPKKDEAQAAATKVVAAVTVEPVLQVVVSAVPLDVAPVEPTLVELSAAVHDAADDTDATATAPV